jgi:rhamnulose-1-phosphate aldolase
MKDILTSSFIKEVSKTIDQMYRLGWDERNGGNLSYILSEEEVRDYLNVNKYNRVIDLYIDASFLSGKIFLVTGSGKYFKNVKENPESNLGIIQINPDGKTANLLWGLIDGAKPTSELSTHLLSHIERLKIDPLHKVVIHTHATNLIAMTFIHSLDEKAYTKTLWKMNTECIIVFPDGIGVIPWMICGNEEIGRETAKKFQESRLIIWAMHGVLGVGQSLDEAFGLIETAEKAAEIFFKISNFPNRKEITDEQLEALSFAFAVKPKSNYLE